MSDKTKTLEEALEEAISAAQAILSFHGHGDQTIYSVEMADSDNLASGDESKLTKAKRCCALWDCTVTNGGRCTCKKWKKC